MSGIEFERRVSLGNILTAGAMFIAIVAGWITLQERQYQLEVKIKELEVAAQGREHRLRTIETTGAETRAELRSINSNIVDLRADIRREAERNR